MNPQTPIDNWFRQASAHADVITSLSARLQIDMEPLDTFAARAHDAIRAMAVPTEDLTSLAHDIYNLLPDGYKTPVPAERNTIAGILAFVFGFLRDFGQGAVICGPQLLPPLKALCARYSLSVAPLDTLAERLLSHFAQMERDAAEAHSAAKALGVEVKDLADQAALLRKAAAGVSMEGIALQSSEAILKTIRVLTAAPGATDIIDHVREVVRQRDLAQAKLEIALRVIVDALPPGHRGTEPITTEHAHKVADLVRAFVRLHNDAMALRDDEIADARKALNPNGPWAPLAELIRDLQADRDRMIPMATTLQAINEALPADLRHSDDLAAAVRSLVLTAETRYGQWDESARDTAPAVQTVAALRYALESRSLRLALARELYDADDNLLDLLETADAHQMTEALLATLATNHAAPEYPPLPKPSALARTLEGPAKVAYFNHSRRAGRVEAIGEDLIRFYPVEGDPVTLNATRRDLEVYHLTADELAAEIARAESRKAPPAETPPLSPTPDVADDDLPF